MCKQKIITLHQPEFMPWMGFFYKILHSDTYVILDAVQFKKNHFSNRNKIRITSKTGWQYINIPVSIKGNSKQNFNQITIQNSPNWKKKLLKAIYYSYQKSNYFDQVYPLIENCINTNSNRLIDINITLILAVLEFLEIKKEILFQSDLNINSSATQLVIDGTLACNSNIYLSGPSGKKYLDHKLLKQHNIEVIFKDFTHPLYKQVHGEFISHMSIIDLLFNNGKQSKNILQGDAL
jgi:hypothetical protein